MHYVIGDVHGCFDELMEMIGLIEKRDADPVFILIGDLVDRGPKVWETLMWAMKHITETGKYQCIMGNHEAQVLEWYRYKFQDWAKAGAAGRREKDALIPRSRFGFSAMIEERGCDTEEQLRPIMEFLDSLPTRKELELDSSLPYIKRKELHREELYEEIQERTSFKIVHAWYLKNAVNESVQQHANIRMRCLTGNPDPSFLIIHGHTPTNKEDFLATDEGNDRPGQICYRANAIDLDGGICYGEKNGYKSYLCALCLEDGEEFYVG